MVLSQYEQAAIRAFYVRVGSLKRVGRELGYSPNTVKKYVQDEYTVNSQNIVRSVCSTDERLIGLYVGLWMGDGTQYVSDGCYTIKICLDSRNTSLVLLVQKLFIDLFGCTSWIMSEKNNNRGSVKAYSVFIYNWISNYCFFASDKTSSVGLLHHNYSNSFFEGVLLGLMLSDGHISSHARFHVISERLARDMHYILCMFGFSPSFRLQSRKPVNWRSIYQVYLSRKETVLLRELLDVICLKVSRKDFLSMKQNDPPGI